MVLFAFGCYPFYNTFAMSKNIGDKYAWGCVITTIGIAFIVWLIIQANNFRQAHTIWFWAIIAIIVIILICYFLRIQIVNMFYNISNRKKQKNSKINKNQNKH